MLPRRIPISQIYKQRALLKNLLHNNGLLIAPTDTVYGLLGNALSRVVLEKIITYKGRAPQKPISIFVPDLKTIEPYIIITPKATAFIHQLTPGPFTFILNLSHKGQETFIPPVKSQYNTIGIRIVKNNVVNLLLKLSNTPLTATSANISGYGPYIDATQLITETTRLLTQQSRLSEWQLIDLIITADHHKVISVNKPAAPSTIIDLTGNIAVIERGDLTPLLLRTAEETGLKIIVEK